MSMKDELRLNLNFIESITELAYCFTTAKIAVEYSYLHDDAYLMISPLIKGLFLLSIFLEYVVYLLCNMWYILFLLEKSIHLSSNAVI